MKHLEQRIQEQKDKTQIHFEQCQDSELTTHILSIVDFDEVAIFKKYFYIFLLISIVVSTVISQFLGTSFYQVASYYFISSLAATFMSLLTVLKIYFTKQTLSIFKALSYSYQFYTKIDFTRIDKETEVLVWDLDKTIIYIFVLPILKQVFVKKFYFLGKYIYRFYEWLIFSGIDYIEKKQLMDNKIRIETLVESQKGSRVFLLDFKPFLENEFPKINLAVNLIYLACCLTFLSFYTITIFLIWLLML